jgi:4-hydroxy-tetrahydrodipicolinate reductase
MTNKKKLRVVQWATGNVGLRSLRNVIEHPGLELVGLYVYADAKRGRDAGELCGLPPTGVRATNSLDEILALKADCVLYMPQYINADELCRILESGTNVVTTRTEFHHPRSMDAALRERVEAACQRGNSSIHSTGSSPGFSTEALPLVLASLERRLDRLHINEYADMSSRNSPQMLFEVMGFGAPLDKINSAGRVHYLREAFGGSLSVVADAIGLPLERIEAHGELAATARDVEIAAGKVAKGTVGAMRTTVSGMRGDQVLLAFTATWYCTTDLDVDWDLRPNGWRIAVDGDVPLDVSIQFPVSEELWPQVSPGLTAHRAVNAVPPLCDAAAGIRTSAELPQIIARLG